MPKYDDLLDFEEYGVEDFESDRDPQSWTGIIILISVAAVAGFGLGWSVMGCQPCPKPLHGVEFIFDRQQPLYAGDLSAGSIELANDTTPVMGGNPQIELRRYDPLSSIRVSQ